MNYLIHFFLILLQLSDCIVLLITSKKNTYTKNKIFGCHLYEATSHKCYHLYSIPSNISLLNFLVHSAAIERFAVLAYFKKLTSFLCMQSEKSKKAGNPSPTFTVTESLRNIIEGLEIILLEEEMNFNARASSLMVSYC